MDKDIAKRAKDMMVEFSALGHKLSRLAHDAALTGDKTQNRQFGKVAKEYQKFFGELKKLHKLL